MIGLTMIRTFRLNRQAVIDKYAKQFKRNPMSCKAFLDEVCGKDMFNIIIQHTAEMTEQKK